MKITNIITLLAITVVILTAAVSAAGLYMNKGGTPYFFETLRGQTAQIYGRGLYQYDTLFFGAGFKGQDVVVLFLGVPLLIFAIFLYQQGSVMSQLLLTGIIGYFLYVYASMALGASYNKLFLLYIAIFSAALFAFVLAILSVDIELITSQMAHGLPRRGLSIFMIAAGLTTLIVWATPLIMALFQGSPPDRMDSYTTMVTYALDLAVITPATFVCAALVLRGNPWGYVIAAPLLIIIIFLVPQIILSTLFQRSAGVPFTTGEMIGPVAGFVVLGSIAAWLLAAIFRGLSIST